MHATLCRLAGLALAASALSAGSASAFYPCAPVAPDACGPGFYAANCYGAVYGPNYYLRPPFPPFVMPPPGARPYGQPCPPGMGPRGGMSAGAGAGYPMGPGGQAPPPLFPTHPYARSPRDYFMYYD